MDRAAHWQDVYTRKAENQVSWYQPEASVSLGWLDRCGVGPDAALIDIGGGASTLVDGLLARGFADLTVLDIAPRALQLAQERLAERGLPSAAVTWISGDVTTGAGALQRYDVWHDRAVFHFLTSEAQRSAYVAALCAALRPGGLVILATFAEDGPPQCSGLPVCRYDVASLQAALGQRFERVAHQRQTHLTPWDSPQHFTWGVFRYVA